MLQNKAMLKILFFLPLLVLFSLLFGCASGPGSAAPGDILEQAALEATAIVRQAQATAIVLQAQSQATGMIAQAANAGKSLQNDQPSAPAPTTFVVVDNLSSGEDALPSEAEDEQIDSEEEDRDSKEERVEIVSIGYGADGGMLVIHFIAPVTVVQTLFQGQVSIMDETNGAIYNEIPVIPKVGPLIGRPIEYGQLGYVMLVNTPPGLPPGSLVTVLLGEYTFEHIRVDDPSSP